MTDEVEQKPPCAHPNFETSSNIVKLAKENGGPVEHYICELQIRCIECKLPFRFIGKKVPIGFNVEYPTMNGDFTEMRIPIKPSNEALKREEVKKLRTLGLILPPNMGRS
jgi:hypothetical protein